MYVYRFDFICPAGQLFELRAVYYQGLYREFFQKRGEFL